MKSNQREIGFGDAWARNTDPGTSEAAADDVRGAKAAALEGVVLKTLRVLGGEGTSEDVSDACGIDLQSISPRFRQMARKGLIEESGKKKPGRSGKLRIVWRIKV